MNRQQLSEAVECALVELNPRQMATLRRALAPGYCLRAASLLAAATRVIIGTGFPVDNTFETDGPLGAIALYRALEHLDVEAYIACAAPLADALSDDLRVIALGAFDHTDGQREARDVLQRLRPDAVLAIERPGLADDGRYYNMRGEDISPRTAVFDYYLDLANCPTIAIGDGGNEVGMGKIPEAVALLDIRGARTSCDELIVADVSNWGAYALIAMLEALSGRALLAEIDHAAGLRYLSERGSVDGVTRENTCTEDGLPQSSGVSLLATLDDLVRQFRRDNGNSPEDSFQAEDRRS